MSRERSCTRIIFIKRLPQSVEFRMKNVEENAFVNLKIIVFARLLYYEGYLITTHKKPTPFLKSVKNE